MAQGMFDPYLLQNLVQVGYQPERSGLDLDYPVDIGIDLYALFLDGVYTRY